MKENGCDFHGARAAERGSRYSVTGSKGGLRSQNKGFCNRYGIGLFGLFSTGYGTRLTGLLRRLRQYTPFLSGPMKEVKICVTGVTV